MPVYFGSNKTTPIYKGTTKIDSIYHGLNLVYRSSLLPSGYTECEYIEATGAQYLNLGNLSNVDMLDFNVVYYKKENASSEEALFDYRSGSTAMEIGFTANMMFAYSTGSTSVRFDSASRIGNIVDYRAVFRNDTNDRIVTAKIGDETLTFTGTGNYIKHNAPMNLFSLTNGSLRCRARVYKATLKTDTSTVFDLIPCLDNNRTPCMYDVISKQTFYNQGTGEFLYAVAK